MLWIGAVLCYIAYSIQTSAYEDPPGDNVSALILPCITAAAAAAASAAAAVNAAAGAASVQRTLSEMLMQLCSCSNPSNACSTTVIYVRSENQAKVSSKRDGFWSGVHVYGN